MEEEHRPGLIKDKNSSYIIFFISEKVVSVIMTPDMNSVCLCFSGWLDKILTLSVLRKRNV